MIKHLFNNVLNRATDENSQASSKIQNFQTLIFVVTKVVLAVVFIVVVVRCFFS